MSEARTGRIGETITSLWLEKINVPNEICHVAGADIIAEYQNIIYRIQVKARQKKDFNRHGARREVYAFQVCKGGKKIKLTREDCDIVAFVCVPLERVIFRAVNDFFGVTIRLRDEEFLKKNIAQLTWHQAVYHLS